MQPQAGYRPLCDYRQVIDYGLIFMQAQDIKPEEHFITDEPYDGSVDDEIAVFTAAYRQ